MSNSELNPAPDIGFVAKGLNRRLKKDVTNIQYIIEGYRKLTFLYIYF